MKYLDENKSEGIFVVIVAKNAQSSKRRLAWRIFKFNCINKTDKAAGAVESPHFFMDVKSFREIKIRLSKFI